MISLLEIAERIRSGQKMDNKEWGIGLFKKLQELIIKYDLKQEGPEKFYEVDDNYADSLFQAATDLLVEVGVYCTTTHRTIRFSEDEVREAARETPSEVTVGEGRDQRVWRKRELEDHRPPSIDVSGHGPWSDAMMPLPIIIRELARHPRVDLIEGYMYARIDGHEVHGKPLCAYAAKRAIEKIRNGVTMAGRRGMAITYYPVLTDAFSLIAPLNMERGLRKTDGVLLTILPDLIIEEDLVAAALIYNELGCYSQCGGTGTGPFGGGIEGRMIESVAGPLAAWMVYRDTLLTAGGASQGAYLPRKGTTGPNRQTSQNSRGTQWQSFAVQQALRRNTNQIYYSIIWGESVSLDDLISEQYLLRVALSSIRTTILGLNFRVGCTNPPTFTSWVVETSDAALKSNMKLQDYEEISARITKEKLSDYQFQTRQDKRMLIYGNNPNEFLKAGLKAYDWYNQTPTDEYLKNERTARKYLRNIGLNI
ncbi:MAG: monomethylamine:corrinoid methyltransferase [Candidatus Bathyarchaeota archaeon]|nr:monomethylamine:corrinoid methyltransferase [Candidatus Bathyarchaeota archaeon]